jgi:hypothetical protein
MRCEFHHGLIALGVDGDVIHRCRHLADQHRRAVERIDGEQVANFVGGVNDNRLGGRDRFGRE